MSENVIILGAGFSHDAGIPMLSNFIERMWEYSIRGKAGESILNSLDQDILSEALNIRSEMDGYHGRVAFDDRNIEDILSMLAFNLLGGGTSDRNKLKAFINAISRTIELSCNVKHPGLPSGERPSYQRISEGSDIYRRFWKALFKWYENEKSLPTIITFNYDLVLERSLFQVLTNIYYNNRHSNQVPFKNLSLDYQYKHFPQQNFEINYARYGGHSGKDGTIMELSENIDLDDCASIELLKLHGSLNFPNARGKSSEDKLSLTDVIENPYILPPVSNKQSNGSGNQSWKTALQRLREAKNVVFVGYSLPKTDMYMQFFLKAALGPNQELNRLFVFDPTLWDNSEAASEMRNRYEMCFSEQLRSRIEFMPELINPIDSSFAGTTEHFVDVIENTPSNILF